MGGAEADDCGWCVNLIDAAEIEWGNEIRA